MTYSRNVICKGLGGISIRRHTDNRILFLNLNSSATFTSTKTEGDAVQGTTSQGEGVDLASAGGSTSFELEVASKKNTRNMDELVLNSIYHSQDNLQVPWTEVHTVSAGSVILNGSPSPVASSMQVSYLDGNKLVASATPTVGQFDDNGDGTVGFHASDNGKQVVIRYMIEHDGVFTQGGSQHETIGYVDMAFHFITGTSNLTDKKGISMLWMPKCEISGETNFQFDTTVQDKTFKCKGVIPDSPADWLVPYIFVHGMELDNTGAG